MRYHKHRARPFTCTLADLADKPASVADKMIKPSIEAASYEKEFVRQALFESGIRLDGRGVDDYRQLSINLERAESSATCEIQLGSTLVMTVVTGEIVTPSQDRPVEGILQFTAHVSPHAELAGASQWELTRMLERSLKDSEALDTESLCIVGGERVWQINCSVNVIDGSGGNIIDACLLSVMAALKAFRKADVSVIPTAYDEEPANSPLPSKGFNLSPTTGSARPNVNILVHHSNSREPLPLSLHHTPITVTLGILKGSAAPPAPATTAAGASAGTVAVPVADSAATEAAAKREIKTILLTDPAREEEAALDGRITFSVNAHNELCALNKPAGRGLNASTIVLAAKIASARAMMLHARLDAAIADLEARVKIQREQDLLVMQRYNMLQNQQPGQSGAGAVSAGSAAVGGGAGVLPGAVKVVKSKKEKQAAGGIDKDDEILQWGMLHKAAGLPEEQKKA